MSVSMSRVCGACCLGYWDWWRSAAPDGGRGMGSWWRRTWGRSILLMAAAASDIPPPRRRSSRRRGTLGVGQWRGRRCRRLGAEWRCWGRGATGRRSFQIDPATMASHPVVRNGLLRLFDCRRVQYTNRYRLMEGNNGRRSGCGSASFAREIYNGSDG